MKFMKKLGVITLSLALAISFDGKPGHTWYETTNGKVVGVTKSKWTAKLKSIGWVVFGVHKYIET